MAKKKKNAYGQHSALSYMCDSDVMLLYNESQSMNMGVGNTMSPYLYNESMSIP